MKIAKVVPLRKGRLKNIPDNYHPISLLPMLSKVLERIVYNFLVKHIDKHSLLYPKQFGFRQNHSTTDGILNLIGETLKCFDDKMMVLSIFVDLQKAFNSVPHGVILAKLEQMGIRGVTLDWFTSYMSNHADNMFHWVKRFHLNLNWRLVSNRGLCSGCCFSRL